MDSKPLGPDGLPAVFEGVWLSHDRQFFWNGTAWVANPHPSTASPWLIRIGAGFVLVAALAYVVTTMGATTSEFAAGYLVGLTLFFGLLVAAFRFAGRWGWFGVLVRGGCVLLGLLRVLALVAHPPAI